MLACLSLIPTLLDRAFFNLQSIDEENRPKKMKRPAQGDGCEVEEHRFQNRHWLQGLGPQTGGRKARLGGRAVDRGASSLMLLTGMRLGG